MATHADSEDSTVQGMNESDYGSDFDEDALSDAIANATALLSVTSGPQNEDEPVLPDEVVGSRRSLRLARSRGRAGDQLLSQASQPVVTKNVEDSIELEYEQNGAIAISRTFSMLMTRKH